MSLRGHSPFCKHSVHHRFLIKRSIWVLASFGRMLFKVRGHGLNWRGVRGGAGCARFGIIVIMVWATPEVNSNS